MKNGHASRALCLFTLAAGQTLAQPDLSVSEITPVATYGTVDGIIAYSFGTTICNIGDTQAEWIDGTNQHPLVSQTLYRLADGQVQQIGIAFAHYPTPPLSIKTISSTSSMSLSSSANTKLVKSTTQAAHNPNIQIRRNQNPLFSYRITSRAGAVSAVLSIQHFSAHNRRCAPRTTIIRRPTG